MFLLPRLSQSTMRDGTSQNVEDPSRCCCLSRCIGGAVTIVDLFVSRGLLSADGVGATNEERAVATKCHLSCHIVLDLLPFLIVNSSFLSDEHHGFEIPDQHFDHIRIRVSGGEIGDEDRRRLQAEVASEWTYFSELRAIAGADSMTAGQAGLNG